MEWLVGLSWNICRLCKYHLRARRWIQALTIAGAELFFILFPLHSHYYCILWGNFYLLKSVNSSFHGHACLLFTHILDWKVVFLDTNMACHTLFVWGLAVLWSGYLWTVLILHLLLAFTAGIVVRISLPSDYSIQLVPFWCLLIEKTVFNEMRFTKSMISVYLYRGIWWSVYPIFKVGWRISWSTHVYCCWEGWSCEANRHYRCRFAGTYQQGSFIWRWLANSLIWPCRIFGSCLLALVSELDSVSQHDSILLSVAFRVSSQAEGIIYCWCCLGIFSIWKGKLARVELNPARMVYRIFCSNT